jgi:hypothetical protein
VLDGVETDLRGADGELGVGDLLLDLAVGHLDEQGAGLDLVSYFDIELGDLAGGGGVGLKLLDGLDLTVGRDLTQEVLERGMGDADPDAFARERADPKDQAHNDEETRTPHYHRISTFHF